MQTAEAVRQCESPENSSESQSLHEQTLETASSSKSLRERVVILYENPLTWFLNTRRDGFKSILNLPAGGSPMLDTHQSR